MAENKGFTIVKNEIINSGNISLKALGLFLYLKSKPKDWRFSTLRIKNDIKDGLSSINTSIMELEIIGLLERRKVKNEKGQFEIRYIFLDEETVIEKPSTEIPKTDLTDTGKAKTRKPVSGKRTNNKKTESTKKEIEIIIEKDEMKPSENGSLFSLPEEPQPPIQPIKKEEGKLYAAMTTIYFDWFKNLSGVSPNFNAAEGSAMKKIMNYFKSLNKENKKDYDGSEFDEVTNMFSFILNHWNLLDDFYQKQTKVTQINSNLQNIINDIKNAHKRKPKSITKDKSANARGERVQNSFNRIDEILANKK